MKQYEHTSSPNFLGGSSDENEKVLGKFLARLSSGAKKKGFPNFSPAPGFFSLWRHWKPLENRWKTVNFSKSFLKTPEIRNEKTFSDQFFRAQKKEISKFFASGGLFFVVEALKTVKVLLGRFYESLRSKWGGGSKNIPGPPLTGYANMYPRS